jgi:hypothetical protein
MKLLMREKFNNNKWMLTVRLLLDLLRLLNSFTGYGRPRTNAMDLLRKQKA